MSAWAFIAGIATLAGSTRTAEMSSAPMRATGAIRLQLSRPEDAVRALMYSSRDGRSGVEVGIVGSNLVIQTVAFGAAGVVVTNNAGDTPSAAPCSVAHGLVAGSPCQMEVQVAGGTVYVYLNGVLKLRSTFTNPYSRQKHWGFVSAVNGARVLSAQLCDLVAQVSPRTTVCLIVCEGNVFYALPHQPFGLLRSNVFSPTGDVALAEFQQKGLGLDGYHAVEIDVTALTAEPWIPDDGLPLPGAVDDGSGGFIPGTSRCTIIEPFLARVAIAGDPQNPQHLWMCASDNHKDWDVGAQDEGRAFGTPTDLPNRIGEPITGLKQQTGGRMVVGCTNSFWRFAGDPALGIPDISPCLLGHGCSGKDAMCLIDGGQVLAHSPDGAFVIPPYGEGYSISEQVLTEGIQIPRASIGSYRVQLQRDTRLHRVYFYLTPRAQGTGPILHFAYDERVGQFQKDTGGFWPDEFPAAMGPSAQCVWDGRVMIGTLDGRVLELVDDLADDDTDAIHTRFCASLIDRPDDAGDMFLRKVRVTPAAASDAVTVSLYGGRTAEEVYTGEGRWLLWEGVVSPGSDAARDICRNHRAAAMLLEFSSNTPGKRIRLESVAAAAEARRKRTRRLRSVPDDPATQSPPPEIVVSPPPPPPPPIGPGADAAQAEAPLITPRAAEYVPDAGAWVEARGSSGGGGPGFGLPGPSPVGAEAVQLVGWS